MFGHFRQKYVYFRKPTDGQNNLLGWIAACIFWKKKYDKTNKYYVAFFILAFRDARMSEDEN